MVGQVFTKVAVVYDVYDNERLIFENKQNRYVFGHIQECCETVLIEEVIGDLSDLEDLPLLVARHDSNVNDAPERNSESYTWTFYSFATFKGYVTVRFLGESNGYYSEEVNIWKETP